MRNHEELVPHNELPDVVPNIGQICGQPDDSCHEAADFSIWNDFGVNRHCWVEVNTVCRAHFDPDDLEYYVRALPLTEYGRTLLTRKEPERPLGTGGS